MSHVNHLICLGLGYTARALCARLDMDHWRISGSARTTDGVSVISDAGHAGLEFSGTCASTEISSGLATCTHLLISTPPGPNGDPVIEWHGAEIAAAPRLAWIGYLSTIGVYGDSRGAWIDETTPTAPASERATRRLDAERQWQVLCETSGKRLQIFRLGGIYGPGRSALDSLREGTARRIVKDGQVFNRIHVDDIAAILQAGIAGGGSSGIYNVVDDEPAPPQDVISLAAHLAGLPTPPEIKFEDARLSPMARSFYAENKRVMNARVKAAFDLKLQYPTYREGLEAIAAIEAPGAVDIRLAPRR